MAGDPHDHDPKQELEHASDIVLRASAVLFVLIVSFIVIWLLAT